MVRVQATLPAALGLGAWPGPSWTDPCFPSTLSGWETAAWCCLGFLVLELCGLCRHTSVGALRLRLGVLLAWRPWGRQQSLPVWVWAADPLGTCCPRDKCCVPGLALAGWDR